VVEGLRGLRFHAIVRRDDKHHQVGGFRATRPHRGERLVARGVDEGDLALVAVDFGRCLVGPDVLGDSAGLRRRHVRVPDRVEQFGLAVIDVTHDGHYRWPRHKVVLAALVLAELAQGPATAGSRRSPTAWR